MPTVLGGSFGGGCFLWARYPYPLSYKYIRANAKQHQKTTPSKSLMLSWRSSAHSGPLVYRATSLMNNEPLLGAYSRTRCFL